MIAHQKSFEYADRSQATDPGTSPVGHDILTLDEVAQYLRVHRSTVYRMVRDGSIPCTKVAKQWRFSRRRVNEWLLDHEGLGEPVASAAAPGRAS